MTTTPLTAEREQEIRSYHERTTHPDWRGDTHVGQLLGEIDRLAAELGRVRAELATAKAALAEATKPPVVEYCGFCHASHVDCRC